ncbi:MAG TPA: response regulator [Steroidobacteraceae bacterium]|nr:response regulator [Steroidobacteraceae bacterium]
MDVLLVEDNKEVSLITVEYLTELGHRTVAVGAAESALQRLTERHFDAVMTDVSLPGMSGIDLARELVKHHPRLPVVIASGYGALEPELILGQRLPGVFVLPKPYDLPMLQRTLGAAAAFASN